jgi:hypothetical protein
VSVSLPVHPIPVTNTCYLWVISNLGIPPFWFNGSGI